MNLNEEGWSDMSPVVYMVPELEDFELKEWLATPAYLRLFWR